MKPLSPTAAINDPIKVITRLVVELCKINIYFKLFVINLLKIDIWFRISLISGCIKWNVDKDKIIKDDL